MHVKLSDEQWERIRRHFPEKSRPKGRRGRPMAPARRVFEAVLVDPPHGRAVEIFAAVLPELQDRAPEISGLGTDGRA